MKIPFGVKIIKIHFRPWNLRNDPCFQIQNKYNSPDPIQWIFFFGSFFDFSIFTFFTILFFLGGFCSLTFNIIIIFVSFMC